MNVAQGVTNQQIFEEIVKNRTELKNFIEASETRLLLKVEELNNRLNIVEQENTQLKQKVEILEQRTIKNNLLIFGLKTTGSRVTPQFICQKLNDLLNVELQISDINNTYSLRSEENSPIKVEFVRYINKINILKNCTKLKGTSISIAHDLTYNQRQENRLLRKHLHLARQEKDTVCYIRKNQLVVNGSAYSLDELEAEEDQQRESNSAPSTPTTNSLTRTDEAIVNKNILLVTIPTPQKTGTIKKQFKFREISKNFKKPRTRSVTKRPNN